MSFSTFSPRFHLNNRQQASAYIKPGLIGVVLPMFCFFSHIYIYAYLRFLRVYVYKHLFIYLLFLINSK
nr:MAG TPA: hypothetical protein [Caudoviricetes sp.]